MNHIMSGAGNSYKASGRAPLLAPSANATTGPVAVISAPSQVRCWHGTLRSRRLGQPDVPPSMTAQGDQGLSAMTGRQLRYGEASMHADSVCIRQADVRPQHGMFSHVL